MRENRTYGSEGGGAQLNALSLPLSKGEAVEGPKRNFHGRLLRTIYRTHQ